MVRLYRNAQDVEPFACPCGVGHAFVRQCQGRLSRDTTDGGIVEADGRGDGVDRHIAGAVR